MKRAIFLLFLLIALFLPVCANAEIVYQVIDLGTLGGQESWANSINNNGQIVGWAQSSFNMHLATLFDPTGGGKNISLHPISGYAYSSALCISDNGQIVGTSVREPIPTTGDAILFDPGTFPNYRKIGHGSASSINNNGQIVGTASGSPSPSRAILYGATGGGPNIYLGGSGSSARSINDNQQIVGYEETSGFLHATVFDPMGNRWKNIDLGTLGDLNSSRANSINDNGQIVGMAFHERDLPIPLEFGHAVLFDPSGSGNNIDMGTLGGDYSEAYSINDCGQIVGWARNNQGHYHAALFDPTGAGNNIDLNTLIDPACGWTLEYANCINNSGWIVGVGINPDGFERAYLLTPEPVTLALLGLGALFLRKRQHRR